MANVTEASHSSFNTRRAMQGSCGGHHCSFVRSIWVGVKHQVSHLQEADLFVGHLQHAVVLIYNFMLLVCP
jgi:hypothetical protein